MTSQAGLERDSWQLSRPRSGGHPKVHDYAVVSLDDERVVDNAGVMLAAVLFS